MTINKYIEVYCNDEISRYKIIGMDVDSFIDILCIQLKNKITFNDITEAEYNKDKSYEIDLDVEGLYQIQHYILKHESKDSERDWKDLIRTIRKDKNRNL